MKYLIILVAITLMVGLILGSITGNAVLNKKDSNTTLISPNHVNEDQINIQGDNIAINLVGKDVRWARYEDTKSMLPLLDKNYNGLETVPTNEYEINKGDVISFVYQNQNYVHRVIVTGYDENGWYAITKGDSNKDFDEGKRRFEDVQGILIGVIF